MSRVVAAARLQLISYQNVIIPWAVLASALAVSLMVFAALQASNPETSTPFTGGLASIYITVAIGFATVMNKNFLFATGLGLTRRGYLLGTGLFALVLAVGSALALYALLGIEKATDGWGLDLAFFGVADLVSGNPFTTVPSYAVPLLASMTLGALYGAINLRWGMIGVYASGVLALLAGGLFLVAVTYAGAWDSIGAFFTNTSPTALLAGYPLIAVVLLGGGTYLISRRVGA